MDAILLVYYQSNQRVVLWSNTSNVAISSTLEQLQGNQVMPADFREGRLCQEVARSTITGPEAILMIERSTFLRNG